MKTLEGKIALITGASKGIGRAIAHTFAEHGAHIAFTYLSSVKQGEGLVEQLKAKGIDAKGYRSDASNHKAAQELITGVIQDFGKLDILINNAGITRDNLLMRMSESDWDEIMEVDREKWKREVILHEELFIELSEHLPKELIFERELLICRL